MANHGGARPGAGRKEGSPNKITGEIREVAQEYGSEAIDQLVKIMRKGKSEQTRVAAAKEILDRGYGKATQHLDGNLGMSHELELDRLEEAASETADWVAEQLKRYESEPAPASQK